MEKDKVFKDDYFLDLLNKSYYMNSEELKESINDLTEELKHNFDSDYIFDCSKALDLYKKTLETRTVTTDDLEKYSDKYFEITYVPADELNTHDEVLCGRTFIHIQALICSILGEISTADDRCVFGCERIHIRPSEYKRRDYCASIESEVKVDVFNMRSITKEYYLQMKDYAIEILSK